MNTEFAPFAHDHAFVEMMKCFEELSLRERLKEASGRLGWLRSYL